MTGDEAAAIVRDLCLEAGHAHSLAPGAEPQVCVHCLTVAHRLKAKHRDETPSPPAVSVHFVVDSHSGLCAAMFDEVKAIEKARAIEGVVVSMPVSSDWREANGG